MAGPQELTVSTSMVHGTGMTGFNDSHVMGTTDLPLQTLAIDLNVGEGPLGENTFAGLEFGRFGLVGDGGFGLFEARFGGQQARPKGWGARFLGFFETGFRYYPDDLIKTTTVPGKTTVAPAAEGTVTDPQDASYDMGARTQSGGRVPAPGGRQPAGAGAGTAPETRTYSQATTAKDRSTTTTDTAKPWNLGVVGAVDLGFFGDVVSITVRPEVGGGIAAGGSTGFELQGQYGAMLVLGFNLDGGSSGGATGGGTPDL
ncbi:MAG: hypothetical protein HYS22_07575 [Deltaproteobacteria bacterium]|nr:hypothetical protein [Deltaproteobacteria bacterium]